VIYKKTILLIIIIILFSCNFYDYEREERIQKYWNEFTLDDMNLVSIYYYHVWILDHIEYRYNEDPDNWQYPQETLDIMKGDCEDRGILLLAIAYYKFNKKGEAIIGINPNNFNDRHFYTYIDGKYYGKLDGYEEILRIPYDEVPYWIEEINHL